MKERYVDEYLQEQLKDPYFKETWELELQKLEVIRPIIEYRIKHDLTQTDLAKQVGVSQQHISNIENGVFADLATVNRILLHIGHKIKIETVALAPAKKRRIIRSMTRKRPGTASLASRKRVSAKRK